MVAINPRKIIGNWRSGIALDVHTTSSTYLGVNEFGHEVYETTRSEIGELLYRLKYKSEATAAKEIIDAASTYLMPRKAEFDLLIPVPPSGARALQPVVTIARGMSEALGIPMLDCITTTRAATQLKGVIDPERRKTLLKGLYAVDEVHTKGKHVLLIDDLFRSGSTMNAITDVLIGSGKAASVRALTITRTRINQ